VRDPDTTFICSVPHKYWGMSYIFDIIEHIEIISWWRGWEPTNSRNTGIEQDMTGKGNKKGNNPAQIADFRRPPPGVVEPRGGVHAHPSTSPTDF